MPTPAAFLSQAATALVALVPGVIRLASDYRDDLEAIPVGATRYQLRGGAAGKAADNSNVSLTFVGVEVSLHHRLPGAERTYTEGVLQTHLEQLVDSGWWRGIAAVAYVQEEGESVIERVGSVVSATVTLVVAIQAGP
ncbi:MAG: hypothetical protein L0221_05185 [Chloroflexi bacterium]|nr:hypothetical protein [Chloroflexota bacterium]